MTNLEKLNRAHYEIQNEFLSADGNEWSADEWRGATGDDWSAEGDQAPSYALRPASQKSPPFIIQIVNAASAAISNVDLGDSFTNRAASNFGQNSAITITSTISGVTYIEFLASTEAQPFKIGRTMIVSTSAGQLDQTIAVTHRNTRGKRDDFIISPTLDPNQNQTDRVIDDTEFLFDGQTRLRFNQINGSATVTVRLYPISVFNATKIVAQTSGNIKFSEPRLTRTAQVMLPR